ncbi:hypothetical protein MXB_3495 [Myxobolus squamalis]|nr:hypothetical protein MXB_3495 [Myxobolus squamalis]
MFSNHHEPMHDNLAINSLTIDEMILKCYQMELQLIGSLLDECNHTEEYMSPSTYVKCTGLFGEKVVEILPPPAQKTPNTVGAYDLAFALDIEGESKKINVTTWLGDKQDTELMELICLLKLIGLEDDLLKSITCPPEITHLFANAYCLHI